jgi:5'-phosphate synthase pdxT subunit
MLEDLGQRYLLVRTRTQLQACDGLILPGGESTTLTLLMKKHDLWEELIRFGRNKPIFGTCAGLIVLAAATTTNHIETLGLIDITVARNAYGRQIDSFIDDVSLEIDSTNGLFEGVFIRAPKIVAMGESVRVLARHDGDVVMAEQDNVLVAAFHPELTSDDRIHAYFLRKLNSDG